MSFFRRDRIETKQPLKHQIQVTLTRTSSSKVASCRDEDSKEEPISLSIPLRYKLASILFVSAIGFGSNWSSGITGAMKTTIKKVNESGFSRIQAVIDTPFRS